MPYGYVAPRPQPEPERWSRRVRGLEPVPFVAEEPEQPRLLVQHEPFVVEERREEAVAVEEATDSEEEVASEDSADVSLAWDDDVLPAEAEVLDWPMQSSDDFLDDGMFDVPLFLDELPDNAMDETPVTDYTEEPVTQRLFTNVLTTATLYSMCYIDDLSDDDD